MNKYELGLNELYFDKYDDLITIPEYVEHNLNNNIIKIKKNSKSYQKLECDEENLIAWYKFDKDLKDSSGNNNHIIGNNSFKNNNITNAVYFNGTYSDYLQVSDTSMGKDIDFGLIQQEKGISFSFWFYHSGELNNKTILKTFQSSPYFYIRQNSTFSRMSIEFTSTNGKTELYASITNKQDTWNHCVFTITNGKIEGDVETKFYLNGRLEPFVSGQSGILDPKIPIAEGHTLKNAYFGGHSTSGTHGFWKGHLNDFRIYDKVLNINEITQLYSYITLNINYNITCDILLVAGGGGGGARKGYNAGGGGGAGEILYKKNIDLKKGKYYINIGSGGEGQILNFLPSNEGRDTEILNENYEILYHVKGGGRGGYGQRNDSYVWLPTDGGSGGGIGRYHSYTKGKSIKYNKEGYGNDSGNAGPYSGGSGGGADMKGISGLKSDGNSKDYSSRTNGITLNITGEEEYYGSGGSGGWQYGNDTINVGYGSGGYGCAATTNETGFGSGGYGSDGIVIIKYYNKSYFIPLEIHLLNYNISDITTKYLDNTLLLNNDIYEYNDLNKKYKVFVFKYNKLKNNNGQTEYTISFNKETKCDILIVGGGGAGGCGTSGSSTAGPGGGGGGLIYLKDQKIEANTYEIKVGKGGDAINTNIRSNNGKNSYFSYLQTEAIGGGGGGSRNGDTSYSTTYQLIATGKDGGSGGGSANNVNPQPTSGGLGYISNLIKYDGTIIISNYRQGYNGGRDYKPNVTNNQDPPYSGGGGGAGGNGYNSYNEFNELLDGNGGIGKQINILKTPIYYAGGGSVGTRNGVESYGGLGGGGSSINVNGINNTGGGGAGSTTGGNVYSGSGGSGIVIIRTEISSYNDIIPMNYSLPLKLNNKIEKIDYYLSNKNYNQNLENIICCRYIEDDENETEYILSFNEIVKINILIVGGGGCGGVNAGGGGGGGGLVYGSDIIINKNEYLTMYVGKGGVDDGNQNSIIKNGKSSYIIYNNVNIIASGGGGGCYGVSVGMNGGSGGGGASGLSTLNYEGGYVNQKTHYYVKNVLFRGYGNMGGIGRGDEHGGGSRAAAGGGGAGKPGNTSGNYIDDQNQSARISYGGDGGEGKDYSDIFGITFGENGWFSGGGGGGIHNNGNMGNPGKGGKGGGGKGTNPYNNGNNPENKYGENGKEGTGGGGGGGGGYWNNVAYGGNGGSGIILIKYEYYKIEIPITYPININGTGLFYTICKSAISDIDLNDIIHYCKDDCIYEILEFKNKLKILKFPNSIPTDYIWNDNGYIVKVKSSHEELHSGHPLWLMFNNSTDGYNGYHSNGGFLSTSPYNYIGTSSFMGINGLPLQIDLGRSIYLKYMNIYPRNALTYPTSTNFYTGLPGKYKIYGSNDSECWNLDTHISWILIHEENNNLEYIYTKPTKIINVNLKEKYRYYTLLVTNLTGNYTHLIIEEWEIYGSLDKNSNEYNLLFMDDTECDVLVVAGGGSGGGDSTISKHIGGGGGAGGVTLARNVLIPKNTNYNLIIGNGGEGVKELGGNNGENSIIKNNNDNDNYIEYTFNNLSTSSEFENYLNNNGFTYYYDSIYYRYSGENAFVPDINYGTSIIKASTAKAYIEKTLPNFDGKIEIHYGNQQNKWDESIIYINNNIVDSSKLRYKIWKGYFNKNDVLKLEESNLGLLIIYKIIIYKEDIDIIESIGGGSGGSLNGLKANSGGSGGGAYDYSGDPYVKIGHKIKGKTGGIFNNAEIYGNNGGRGYYNSVNSQNHAGGGGGAMENGKHGFIDSNNLRNKNNGGNGIDLSNLFGNKVGENGYFGGGGGGGSHTNQSFSKFQISSRGGLGGGGDGGYRTLNIPYHNSFTCIDPNNGISNTGGGGGGSGSLDSNSINFIKSGSGGSGVILIKYKKYIFNNKSFTLIKEKNIDNLNIKKDINNITPYSYIFKEVYFETKINDSNFLNNDFMLMFWLKFKENPLTSITFDNEINIKFETEIEFNLKNGKVKAKLPLINEWYHYSFIRKNNYLFIYINNINLSIDQEIITENIIKTNLILSIFKFNKKEISIGDFRIYNEYDEFIIERLVNNPKESYFIIGANHVSDISPSILYNFKMNSENSIYENNNNNNNNNINYNIIENNIKYNYNFKNIDLVNIPLTLEKVQGFISLNAYNWNNDNEYISINNYENIFKSFYNGFEISIVYWKKIDNIIESNDLNIISNEKIILNVKTLSNGLIEVNFNILENNKKITTITHKPFITNKWYLIIISAGLNNNYLSLSIGLYDNNYTGINESFIGSSTIYKLLENDNLSLNLNSELNIGNNLILISDIRIYNKFINPIDIYKLIHNDEELLIEKNNYKILRYNNDIINNEWNILLYIPEYNGDISTEIINNKTNVIYNNILKVNLNNLNKFYKIELTVSFWKKDTFENNVIDFSIDNNLKFKANKNINLELYNNNNEKILISDNYNLNINLWYNYCLSIKYDGYKLITDIYIGKDNKIIKSINNINYNFIPFNKLPNYISIGLDKYDEITSINKSIGNFKIFPNYLPKFMIENILNDNNIDNHILINDINNLILWYRFQDFENGIFTNIIKDSNKLKYNINIKNNELLIFNLGLINNNFNISGLDDNNILYDNVISNNNNEIKISIKKGKLFKLNVETTNLHPFIIVKSDINPIRENNDLIKYENIKYNGIYNNGLISGNIEWNTNNSSIGRYYGICINHENMYFIIDIISDNIVILENKNIRRNIYPLLNTNNLATKILNKNFRIETPIITEDLSKFTIMLKIKINGLEEYNILKFNNLILSISQNNIKINISETINNAIRNFNTEYNLEWYSIIINYNNNISSIFIDGYHLNSYKHLNNVNNNNNKIILFDNSLNNFKNYEINIEDFRLYNSIISNENIVKYSLGNIN